jgi:hypothetical protein
MSDESLFDVMAEFEKQEKLHSNEGRHGVENLCRLVHAMGYEDPLHFGQFAHNASIGDLISFLEDNPGCIEAIKNWIGEQDIEEWKESLLSYLPVKYCDECGGEIPTECDGNCES